MRENNHSSIIPSNTTFRVNEFLLIETGTYETQIHRPFSTEYSASAVMGLKERLDRVDRITPGLLSTYGPSLLKPSATGGGDADIIEGWKQRRYRFMMSVSSRSRLDDREFVVLGYTEHDDFISSHDKLDPNTTFYINTMIDVKRRELETNRGLVTESFIGSASHLFAEDNVTDQRRAHRDQRFMLRPVDSFSAMANSTLLAENTVLDTTRMMGRVANKSRRNNALASHYMANVLDAYTQATRNGFGDMNPTSILTEAGGYVDDMEGSAITDPFLAAIAGLRGRSAQRNFTLKELFTLDPNADNVMEIRQIDRTPRLTSVMSDEDRFDNNNETGDSDSWNGSNMESQVGAILAQSVLGLMAELGVMYIRATMTNETMDKLTRRSFHDVKFSDVRTFGGMRVKPLAESILTQLRTSILPGMCMEGRDRQDLFDYHITAKFELWGETVLQISINGKPAKRYCAASFADANFSPLFTNNAKHSLELASDLESVLTTVGPDLLDYANDNDDDYRSSSSGNTLSSLFS